MTVPASPTAPRDEALLVADDLHVHYGGGSSLLRRLRLPAVRAVDGVTLEVGARTVLGLVGESGSGKSTLGRTLVGLEAPTSGRVLVDGVDLGSVGRRSLRRMRRRMQMVFQDPLGSLNPRIRIGAAVAEPIIEHDLTPKDSTVKARVDELLELVGLAPSMRRRFPHELSGGQCQRVAIARAIASEPDLIVCDEPVSALDVSIQAQILNLFMKLHQDFGLTYVFVAHDLAAVRRVSTDVAVMYLGRIVEQGRRDAVFDRPAHPYTVSLLASIPNPEMLGSQSPYLLKGDLPSPSDALAGCPFRSRCWLYERLGRPDRCRNECPTLAEVDGRTSACHFAAEVTASMKAT